MADPSTLTEEEEKKIHDIIQKLNDSTKIWIQRYKPEIENAEINFKEGYRGEAYLELSSVLEFQLFHLWTVFVQHSTGKFKPFEGLFDLKTYTEMLWHVEYISTSQRSDLKAFQKGRNTLAHYTSKHFQIGHPSDENLEDQFKKGLKISKELTNILKEKSPKFKFEPR